MSVYQRPRSPYWWMWIPGLPAGPGTNPINTKIPIGCSAAERKENKQIAEQILATRVLKAGKVAAGLPLEADPADVILFTTWAATYKEQEIPKHRGAYRELGILPRLLGDGDFADVDGIGRLDLGREPFVNRVTDISERLGFRLALRMTARQGGTRDGVAFVAVDEEDLIGHGSCEYMHTGIIRGKLEHG